MKIVCTDLEGVLVPEIWINVAEKTGIEQLRLTTRDIADYSVLMRKRIDLLEQHGLKLKDIKDVIETMQPLEGAREFLDWLRAKTQTIIVSDTFEEFARPLMAKLGWPTLFCNSLQISSDGKITDYILRQADGKRHVVQALQSLNFKVVAMGDSYNDISMLKTAEHSVLFSPPDTIKQSYPEFAVVNDYKTLQKTLARLLD
ncbi:MAG: bifunctional phosphoserine phosphatase/homoserine phosphotransferase ThrH [Desulfobacteraceae bacterium]|nr:bifunctional phosphoserine phosphatase/homoserine phosphotransferase ThrH [Desulfobacteraceae bacterium]